jgi:aminomethyltransferase
VPGHGTGIALIEVTFMAMTESDRVTRPLSTIDDLPRHFGDARAEYEALRRGAGIIDCSPDGKLAVSGRNAVQFLNGLVSNDVKSLAPGAGVFAAFPNLQGKVVALCRIYNRGSHFLLALDASTREKIFANLSRFVPAGDFFVDDLSAQLALLSVQGPQAQPLIEEVIGAKVALDDSDRVIEHRIDEAALMIAVNSRCGGSGFDLYLPAAAGPQLLDRLEQAGGSHVGREAVEIARIESGIPREPVDVNENYILLETGLDEAVSYTKGCYLGQEIIARIHWRGQPAKRMRGLLIDGDEVPAPGTPLFADAGKKVGEVTSSARSFALDRVIALGYVHRAYLDPGTQLMLPVEGRKATVAPLPMAEG